MNIYIGGHPLSTYAKFSGKLTFRNILRTYLMDDPLGDFECRANHDRQCQGRF